MSKDILIIALTGMPGAGKTTIASFLSQKGFPVVTMGDLVREVAGSKGLEPTSDNLAKLMKGLREEKGPSAIAHLIVNKIKLMKKENAKINVVIVDGIRSMTEVKVLKLIGIVKLLSIHASPITRYTHLKERGRSDTPSNINDFNKRDKGEMDIGISDALALSDEMVSNNDISIHELCKGSLDILQTWIREMESEIPR